MFGAVVSSVLVFLGVGQQGSEAAARPAATPQAAAPAPAQKGAGSNAPQGAQAGRGRQGPSGSRAGQTAQVPGAGPVAVAPGVRLVPAYPVYVLAGASNQRQPGPEDKGGIKRNGIWLGGAVVTTGAWDAGYGGDVVVGWKAGRFVVGLATTLTYFRTVTPDGYHWKTVDVLHMAVGPLVEVILQEFGRVAFYTSVSAKFAMQMTDTEDADAYKTYGFAARLGVGARYFLAGRIGLGAEVGAAFGLDKPSDDDIDSSVWVNPYAALTVAAIW